jgi:hypothetical protein
MQILVAVCRLHGQYSSYSPCCENFESCTRCGGSVCPFSVWCRVVLQSSRRSARKRPTSVMHCGKRRLMAPASWGRVSTTLIFVLCALLAYVWDCAWQFRGLVQKNCVRLNSCMCAVSLRCNCAYLSMHHIKRSYPLSNRLWRPIGLWDLKEPKMGRQLAHRWGYALYSP